MESAAAAEDWVRKVRLEIMMGFEGGSSSIRDDDTKVQSGIFLEKVRMPIRNSDIATVALLSGDDHRIVMIFRLPECGSHLIWHGKQT